MRTAEYVSPAHPDKMCDRISDAILDECLRQDESSRVAIETMGGHGKVVIMGELKTKAKIDFGAIVKRIAGDVQIITNIKEQSPEIANGVDIGGAGDQGVMIGYATSETPEFLPLELMLARSLNQFIYAKFPFDGKTQITINGRGRIAAAVISWQNVSRADLQNLFRMWTYKNCMAAVTEDAKIYANPAGDWVIGGFEADTGLTGRKLAIDNYGPGIALGGGCFSGKDGTKVDRSGAYMARFIARRLLENSRLTSIKGPDTVRVQLAYAIGEPEPVELSAILNDKAMIHRSSIENFIGKLSLTPKGIIDFLGLKKPIFEDLAAHGHFGRSELKWES